MSRTIRRKTGDRWFACKQTVRVHTGRGYYTEGYVYEVRKYSNILDKRPVCWLRWETIYGRPEYDHELISRYTRDYSSCSMLGSIKEYDNYTRRACQRQQLRAIIKGQEHYDDSFEDSKCKGAKWYFD